MRLKYHLKRLLIVLLFTQNVVFAHNQIDSLLTLLQERSGNEQVNVLNDLSISYRLTSLNKALEYADQAIVISKKNEYLIGEADGYKNRGVVFFLQHKYDEAIVEFNKASELYSKENKQSRISAILNNKANIWVVQGEYQKALDDYVQAAEISIELGYPTSVANIYNNIGMVYIKWGNTEKAMEYYTKSLDLSIKQNNKIGIAAAYNNIALIQKSLGQYDSAIEYYHNAIKINEEIGDKAGISRCLTNLASVYSELGETQEALANYKEALEIEKELNNDQGVLKSYSKIGELHLKAGEYDKAIKSFKQSLAVAQNDKSKENMMGAYRLLGATYKKMQNYDLALEYYNFSLDIAHEIENNRSKAHLIYSIAQCYSEMNKQEKAMSYYLQFIELAQEYNLVSQMEGAYLEISKRYSEMGDFKSAYRYQSKYIDIHEKIFSDESQKRIDQLQTSFETEKKEKKILQLKELQQHSKQTFQLTILGSAFVLLLIIMGLIINQFLNKRKSIQLLDQKNLLLEKVNKDLIQAKEKAEESDRLKTAFLANISHEIRTPMNAIIGFSDFLVDPLISKQEKDELLRLVNLNSDILLNLIDDILDVALIESGQLNIRKEKIVLNKLVGEVYELLKDNKKITESQIQLRSQINNPNEEFVLFSDSFRLKQVLMNLILNAIKFTKTGAVTFGYRIFSLNGEKMIQFEVEDTGIGIDKEYHDVIFDLFYKVPSDNSTFYPGTGVGLSISKSLIEQMGGEIWLQSALNKGTTFFFTIPAENTSI